MEPINEVIRKNFNTLTNRQKMVAQFILEHPQHIAFQKAKEVGELTKTSETTVIRLCYALGYKGFTHLQKEIQSNLLDNGQTDPLEKYRVSTGALSQNSVDLIHHIKEQEIAFIEKNLDALDPNLVQKVIEAILYSKKRCIVGLRSSYAAANWLAFSLNIVKGNTHLYRGEIDDAISLISDMDKESLVIAFSFPRYAQETISFVKAAKKKGAKIIAITDNELSPLGSFADLLIKVYTPSPTGLNGMATMFSLLNVIVSGVASSKWEEVHNRINDYEQTSEQFFPFFKQETD
ncbi:MurR/RpiR family transcriptional regulator [Fictibacillus enclensis]|uniref:MurR/RpiR family transcriptional regulator n=1 Tax=Fictibacillus enclensis TaxID=1017270 RepID=UPI0024C06ACE|nr:MurR/RpiR family transcriptional regulator [Fictibacillus enclensis]WHY74521.1 MurR/RpiR family transcriptional regulator [Fictibacillus enclensis]